VSDDREDEIAYICLNCQIFDPLGEVEPCQYAKGASVRCCLGFGPVIDDNCPKCDLMSLQFKFNKEIQPGITSAN
jgi:hypothetical protein